MATQERSDNPEDLLSRLSNAREFFLENGARGAAPPDLYKKARWTMCGCHLVIIEGLASIYSKALSIPRADEIDFAGYALQWARFVHHHHWHEETIFFPGMEPQYKTPAVEEHARFTDTLLELEGWLEKVTGLTKGPKGAPIPNPDPNTERANYDGEKLKGYFESMFDPLMDHLHHEIEYLDAEKIKSSGVTLKQLHDIEEASKRLYSRDVDHFSISTFIILHSPPGCGFPGAPAVVKKVLVPWVLYWKHRNWWRFAPKW